MSPRHAAKGSPRDILFAMADVDVAEGLVRIAESRSHAGVVASSLVEALHHASTDVLVAEFGERSGAGMDGLEVLQSLRALGHNPACILIDSGAGDRDYAKAMGLGVDAILERPIHPETLIHAIEQADEAETEAQDFAELSLYLDADPCAGENAAREILGWCLRCEITPATRARIGTAIAEIVQNAADHARSPIDIDCEMRFDELHVTVRDTGHGFDAAGFFASPSFDCSTGLGRAHALSDHMKVVSEGGYGTEVSMHFRVSAVEFDDESRIDLSDLDFFVPATSKELLTTLSEQPDAPIVLSPALAVVVGRLLMGPGSNRVLESALRS